MARSIDPYLTVIQQSVYGKDIRTAIYNALRTTYDELTDIEAKKIDIDYNAGRIRAADVWAYADACVITSDQATNIAGPKTTSTSS